MQIHKRIIEAYPDNLLIVVRFWTDVVSESYLSEIDNPENAAQPLRCSSDRSIRLPMPVPTAAALDALIMSACNWQELEFAERKILNETTANAELSAAQSAVTALLGSTSTLTHAGTPVETPASLLAKDLAQIDADVDSINLNAAGLRTVEYEMAESAAQAYKDGGYTGSVSPLISVWTANNNKGLTTDAQAADDILAQAAAWRGAVEAMRIQRLSRKKERTDGVPNTMALWNGFVAALRAQLFPNG
jgi:hypothetical protein